ncbi:MAG: PIN domain-containing protein [Gammaproteobacteria bacterium]|nr:PIN domain-containing protein [Gammaproteobacteria bacterium]
MMVLDTNVLFALIRNPPEAVIVAWLDRQSADAIWITITLFETRLGLSLLPDGRRRHAPETAFARLLEVELNSRVLPLDSAAAAHAALVAAERQRTGRTVDIRDTLIAGIAQARRASRWI